jgi:guanosine-3',5'-bis(diphosphate) 3'-pyrophosphohydrolase
MHLVTHPGNLPYSTAFPPPAADLQAPQADGDEFFALIESYLNSGDRQRVRDAFELARREHGDQRRRSGELFFTHPLTVAYYLAEYRLDACALAAALLHDAAEDTRLSLAEISAEFGPEVSRLVDGVTKLKEISAGVSEDKTLSAEDVRDATLHKLFEAMTTDVRVVIIKLFDRLHNMRTIKAMPPHKQEQKAAETLAIYAPLANRLGIWRLKNELEALSLEVLDSRSYHSLKQELEHLYHEQQENYAAVMELILETLIQAGIKVINVLPSPENIYSTYQAAVHSNSSLQKVDKTLRLVVLLEDADACYRALGQLHGRWQPVPGTFDDYIARPRDNLYRALHTTVIYHNGQPLKLRFRTVAMNEVSEIGVLARWVYAGTPLWTRGIAERVEALFANISENISLEPQDRSLGVRGVVEDVFRKQIMVYTPRGDVLELPQGATPIDFAYTIHTQVGNQCHAAIVNEQRYPLNRPLHDGDRVRIIKTGFARPHRTWLDEDLGYIASTRTRTVVRRWFRRLPQEIAIAEGRRLLQEELTMLGLPDYPHKSVATLFGYDHEEMIYYALGRAELLPTVVATRALETAWDREPSRSVGNVIQSPEGEEYVIQQVTGRKLRLCLACDPRPGDRIVGFVRADNGVTVHKEGCLTLRPDPLADRTIKLSWAKEGAQEVRLVTVRIDVHDRKGLLLEIARLLEEESVNISAVNTPRQHGRGETYIILDLEIGSPRQVVSVLHRIHALVNVFSVRCLLGNHKESPDWEKECE